MVEANVKSKFDSCKIFESCCNTSFNGQSFEIALANYVEWFIILKHSQSLVGVTGVPKYVPTLNRIATEWKRCLKFCL